MQGVSGSRWITPLAAVFIYTTFVVSYVSGNIRSHTDHEPFPQYISTIISFVPESMYGSFGFGLTAALIAAADIVKHASILQSLEVTGHKTHKNMFLANTAFFFGLASAVGLLGTGAIQRIYERYAHMGFAGCMFVGAGTNEALLCYLESQARDLSRRLLLFRRCLAISFWIFLALLLLCELTVTWSVGSAMLEWVEVALHVSYMLTYYWEFRGLRVTVVKGGCASYATLPALPTYLSPASSSPGDEQQEI